MKKNKLFLFLIAFIAFGQTVWAQNTYIDCSWDAENKTVVQTHRDIPSNVATVTSSTAILDNNCWYIVRGAVTISDRLDCRDGVKLILADNAQLTLEEGMTAFGSLTIYCQSYGSSMGKLTIPESETWSAGIGTTEGYETVIHGGNINVNGDENASGIGGRWGENGSTVIIYGGRVEAHGGDYGAGIGGGTALYYVANQIVKGHGGHLTVYGGSVYAYGGSEAAGIGGGGHHGYSSPDYADWIDLHGGTFTIYGGYVEAHGGKYAAGIGGGRNGNGCTSVNIKGGTVKAYGGTDAAGIGSGEQKVGTRHGGSFTITGGNVEAHGGKYGAGIGGGQDASGANVTISGGIVNAYGGTDAAGVGSGEEVSAGEGAINGGTLTVTGGYLFADGTDVGCGIGGGQDADGATVNITGGTVVAWCGSGSRTSAIGSNLGDNHRGTLHIGDSLMVHAGSNSSSASLFPSATRVPACFYRDYARIEPCDHQGATYTVNGTGVNGTHTLHCTHCLHSPTHTHTFENGICTVCGAGATICTVSVYMPVYDSGTNTYSYGSSPRWTVQLVAGSSFELPAPRTENMPVGVRFVGWRIGSPGDLGLTDPHVGENEDLFLAGDSYTVTGDISLTPRYRTYHVFTTAGNWNEPANWCWSTVPTADKEIVIAADVTIPAGYTAEAGNVTVDLEGSLTIADGGQLIHSNEGVVATVEKNITGRTTEESVNKGWAFIASPVTTGLAPTTVTNMTATDFDLYRFNQNANLEWENYKQEGEHYHFDLENGRGYLYNNVATVDLQFTGTINPAMPAISVNLEYTPTAEFAGWNLVGNPFTFNAAVDKPYYTLDANGTAIPNTSTQATVPPCTGIMVHVDEANQSITFSKPTQGSAPSNGNLNIAVAKGNMRGTSTTLDKAIVSFSEGNELEKFIFDADLSKLYIPQDGKDYAIACAETTDKMPLNFEPSENGTYTLMVNPEGVEMAYLHLIDNMTGADVNLLASPSYSFTAKTSDYASRFRLVFSDCEDADGDNEAFAFINNGNIIVNGEGVLQIVDVTGRIIHCTDVLGNVSTSGMTPGVYVLRLIDDDNVRIQKIIVSK